MDYNVNISTYIYICFIYLIHVLKSSYETAGFAKCETKRQHFKHAYKET